MAAITVTQDKKTIFGDLRVVVGSLAFPSSYSTGGDDLTPQNMGLSKIQIVLCEQKNGYTFEYDYTNEKMKAYWQRIIVTDLDTPEGTGVALYFDEDGASQAAKLLFESPTNANGFIDMAPIEVRATTDLSTNLAAVRFIAIGK